MESRPWVLFFRSLPLHPSTGLCSASGVPCQNTNTMFRPGDMCIGFHCCCRKTGKKQQQTKHFILFRSIRSSNNVFARYELSSMLGDAWVAGWNKSGHIYVNTVCANMQAHVWGGGEGIHVRKPEADLLTQLDLAPIAIASFHFFPPQTRHTKSTFLGAYQRVDRSRQHIWKPPKHTPNTPGQERLQLPSLVGWLLKGALAVVCTTAAVFAIVEGHVHTLTAILVQKQHCTKTRDQTLHEVSFLFFCLVLFKKVPNSNTVRRNEAVFKTECLTCLDFSLQTHPLLHTALSPHTQTDTHKTFTV